MPSGPHFNVEVFVEHEDDIPDLQLPCAEACAQVLADYYDIPMGDGSGGNGGGEHDPSSVGGY